MSGELLVQGAIELHNGRDTAATAAVNNSTEIIVPNMPAAGYTPAPQWIDVMGMDEIRGIIENAGGNAGNIIIRFTGRTIGASVIYAQTIPIGAGVTKSFEVNVVAKYVQIQVQSDNATNFECFAYAYPGK